MSDKHLERVAKAIWGAIHPTQPWEWSYPNRASDPAIAGFFAYERDAVFEAARRAIEACKEPEYLGFLFERDRRWRIHTPEFSGIIFDYNNELTGFDKRFATLDPEVFYYGGNAYYITGAYACEKGFLVEEVPR